jgi:hypothetical protein
MAKQGISLNEFSPAFLVREIQTRDLGHLNTRTAKDAALARRLKLHPKTVTQIRNGGYCGQQTAAKLHSLAASPKPKPARQPARPRSRRVTVTFPDAPADLVDAIQKLPPETKRTALIDLVEQGENSV